MSNTINAAGHEILQNDHPHRIRTYLSVLKPQIVYQGTVTGSPDPGEVEIEVVDVAGDITDIVEGMTVLIGSTPGDDDITGGGRRRFRSRAGQVLTLDENWIIWADGMHITVIETWELWPIFPFITVTEPYIFYKDKDIAYSDQNEDVDPVAIIKHNHAAKFLDGPTVPFNLNGALSYPMANGATITDYLWECNSGVIADSTAAVTTITFDTPNKNGYWVHLTVTDSNGKTHTTRRVRFVHTRTGTHAPHYDFSLVSVPTGDWGKGGWSMSVEVRDDADITNFPDKALCILWGEETYNGVLHNVGKDSTMQFCGYIRGDSISVNSTGDSYVRFLATTVDDLMRRHKMFSVSLEDKSDPTTWYEYSANGTGLTVAGAVHHLWHWHSTLLNITNVFLPTDNVTRFPACDDFINGNLYTMAENFAVEHGIFAHICCDKYNQVYMEIDVNMLGVPRASITIGMIIEERDKKGDPEISFIRETERVVSYGTASGVSFDGTTTTPLTSVAPGDVPHVDGDTEFVLERLILVDQADGNRVVGRAMAILNNPFKQFPVKFAGNYSFIDMVPQFFYKISIAEEDTKRGVVFDEMRIVPRMVVNKIDTDQGTLFTEVTFDVDATGQDGIAGNYPTDLADTPEPPPLFLLEAALVSFDSVNGCYVKSSWTERNGILAGADIQDQFGGKDPWWHVNQSSLDVSKGILWKCDVGAIFRSTNLGVSWTEKTPAVGPEGFDPTAMTYIQYEGNVFFNHEHLFLARILDSGTWYSYILRTDDDGVTWNWGGIGKATASSMAFGALQQIGAVEHFVFSGQGGNPGAIHSIAVLSETTVVLFDVSFRTADSFYMTQMWVCDISGDAISEGAKHTIGAFKQGTPFESKHTEVDSETVMSIWLAWQTGTKWTALIQAGSVNVAGKSISQGNILNWESKYGVAGSRSATWRDVSITGLSSTTAVVTMSVYLAIVEFTGNSISWGTSVDYFISPNSNGYMTNTCRLTDTKFVTGFRCFATSQYRTKVVVGDYSGVVTLGSEYDVNFDTSKTTYGMDICRLSDDRFAIVWIEAFGASRKLYTKSATVTGNVPDFGAVTTVFDGSTFSINCNRIDDLHYQISYVEGVADIMSIAIATVDADTNAVSLNADGPWIHPGGIDDVGGGATTRMLSATKAIVWRIEDDCPTWDACYATAYIVTYTPPGYEGKAYGMSIGKGGGIFVYVTYSDDTDLYLQRLNSLTLALLDEASLGNATIAEVDAEIWKAIPQTIVGGSDLVCLIYGRMNDPLGAGVAHVIWTNDGGVSGTLIEGGWGANVCSAIRQATTGEIIAVRDGSPGSKLYGGTVASLAYVSDIPIRVNHGAMRITTDFYVILAGRVVNEGKMVLYSVPPYDTWVDATEDLPTDGNIKALALL